MSGSAHDLESRLLNPSFHVGRQHAVEPRVVDGREADVIDDRRLTAGLQHAEDVLEIRAARARRSCGAC